MRYPPVATAPAVGTRAVIDAFSHFLSWQGIHVADEIIPVNSGL